jgi:hypothetical protein
MKKTTPSGSKRIKQKYREGLLTLLSLQPELSEHTPVQSSPTDDSQQDGNPVPQHGDELKDSAGIPAAAFNSIVRSNCQGIYRQYNELNRHIKALAVYLWHADEESPGESQQFHVGQAIEKLSHVRKESWNLRVKLEENATLIREWSDEDEEVQACT